MYVIQHCFVCRPSDSTVLEDAGIEHGTVATLGSARSDPRISYDYRTFLLYPPPPQKKKNTHTHLIHVLSSFLLYYSFFLCDR
jgi:hypothetical protein